MNCVWLLIKHIFLMSDRPHEAIITDWAIRCMRMHCCNVVKMIAPIMQVSRQEIVWSHMGLLLTSGLSTKRDVHEISSAILDYVVWFSEPNSNWTRNCSKLRKIHSNLAGAGLCRYNFCTWQVWHETHICCQGMRKICSDDQKMKYDKMKF